MWYEYTYEYVGMAYIWIYTLMIRVLEYTGGRVKNKLKWSIIKDNLKIKIRSMYVDGLIFCGVLCVFCLLCFGFAKDAHNRKQEKSKQTKISMLIESKNSYLSHTG